MVKRKYNNKIAEENYLNNMLALCWQEHFIKYDRNKQIFILGVNIEGINYFREIELKYFAGETLNNRVSTLINILLAEIAEEVIKWKETKESKEYQDWIKKNHETK